MSCAAAHSLKLKCAIPAEEIIVNPVPLDWIILFYCLMRKGDGRYIGVNRRYKPIGMDTKDWVDYEEFEGLDVKFTEEEAKLLSHKKDGELCRIVLFNDGTAPWRGKRQREAYEKKIALLLKILKSRGFKSLAQLGV